MSGMCGIEWQVDATLGSTTHAMRGASESRPYRPPRFRHIATQADGLG